MDYPVSLPSTASNGHGQNAADSRDFLSLAYTYSDVVLTPNKVPDRATVIRLRILGKGSTVPAKFTTKFKFRARISIPSNGGRPLELPPSNDPAHNVKLTVGLHSIKLNPSIRVLLELRRFSNVAHLGYVDFFLASSDEPSIHDHRSEKTGFLQPKLDLSTDDDDDFAFSFESRYAVATNLRPGRNSKVGQLSAVEERIITYFESLCERNVPLATVKFIAQSGIGKHNMMLARQLVDTIEQGLAATRKCLMHPYSAFPTMSTTAEAVVYPKELIQKGHPWLQIPRSVSFPSLTFARIAYTNGLTTLFDEEVLKLKALEANYHHARVFNVGDTFIVAVKWTRRPAIHISDKAFSISDGADVNLRFENPQSVPDVCAQAIVLSDTYNFCADLALLVTQPVPPGLSALAIPYQSRMDDTIPMRRIRLTASANENLTQEQRSAVKHVYTSSFLNRARRGLTDILFTQPHHKIDSLEPFSSVDSLAREWLEWIDDPVNMFSPSQKAALAAFLSVKGGFLLISGAGGSGKTFLLCKLTQFLAEHKSQRYKVVICSERNKVLDHIAVEYDSKYRSSGQSPLRTTPASKAGFKYLLELNKTQSRDDLSAASRLELSEMLLRSQYKAIMRTASAKGRAVSELTIEQAVDDLLATTSEVDFSLFVLSLDGTLVEDDASCDAVAYLRERVHKIRYNDLVGAGGDFDDELDNILQAFWRIVDQIVGEKRVLVSTIGSITGRAWQEFGRNCEQIIVCYDEAPTIMEPSTLIPLTQPKWSDKVDIKVMLGDLTQLRPLVISQNSNCFQPQLEYSLFHRLDNLGWEVHFLKEQKRSHDAIFNYMNDIFYHGIMSSTGKFAPLPTGLKHVYRQVFGYPEIADFHDDDLRFTWARVIGGRTRTSSKTGSRANLENAKLVIRIITLLRRHRVFRSIRECVGIITPYARQVQLYNERFTNLKMNGWTDDDCPEILTVDSAQGYEKYMILLDLVNTDTFRQGFVTQHGRLCVALTRAKEVQWIVSAKMVTENHPSAFRRPARDLDDDEELIGLDVQPKYESKWILGNLFKKMKDDDRVEEVNVETSTNVPVDLQNVVQSRRRYDDDEYHSSD